MSKRYCFFCVGTGGHVFPAKNMVLMLIESGVSEDDIIVVSDNRGLRYFEDLNLHTIKKNFYISNRGISGYVVNIGRFIRTVWDLYTELKSKKINSIFTTGAYIAPYAAFISLLIRSELFIQEQNQYAGLGNKIASYFPSTVFESFPNTKNINNTNSIYTGPILNLDLNYKKQKKENTKFTIGIQGGSQGSQQINKFIFRFINNLKESEVNFIHITGPEKSNVEKINKSFYREVEFIDDMNEYYHSIDFQISRAGGGILEAAFLQIPQLLIPFQFGTTARHQTLNAKYLTEIGNAKIVNEYEQFVEILNNLCDFKNGYLQENFIFKEIKVGNDDIFKIITSGSHG
ncbi:UDP-N-acetylglucosamine--N-acetylmuramyl-(pentapeptide) pyrophosphoryl-undecaprenol N-acetylglucosamine transferase [Candidatus Actinomarina]|nr:UDP-N-acetylglucosamine--N-acetylmuramyl-(pentapeptide) pyrophosphoryl-undecaprenol N-acetylglucosamine transferase [Candidatus Actinomarina sp.]